MYSNLADGSFHTREEAERRVDYRPTRYLASKGGERYTTRRVSIQGKGKGIVAEGGTPNGLWSAKNSHTNQDRKGKGM